MQAQAQVRPGGQLSNAGWTPELMWVAIVHIAIHVLWIAGPWLAPDHDFPAAARFVTLGSLAVGVLALGLIWKGVRAGWWLMVILTIVNLLLTAPEVLTLPGVLRVISIFALLALIATMVLLFRPGLRTAKGRV